jgi:hypothetical protein
MSGVPAADPDDLATNHFGDARRIVENDRGCHDKIESTLWKRQFLAASQEQGDAVVTAQVFSRDGELGWTEVDAHQRDIEQLPKLAQQFSVAAANFEH